MAGAAKVKKDPFAPIRDRIIRLTVHLEKVKQRMNSGTVSERHANKAEAYKEWIKREYDRTYKKLEDLKFSLPAGK